MQRIALIALALALSPVARAADWNIDAAHSEVGFSVRHMMVTDVKGTFDKFTGTIAVDDADMTKATIAIDIDAASANTKNQKRDEHLKGADFFDVAKTPKITFKSTKVEKGAAAGTFKVTGDLTMRGVTKPVTLDVTVSEPVSEPKEWGGNTRRGVSASAKISRKDWGINWQTKLDKGGVVVGEEVTLAISVELIKAAAKK
jgi:polyisoprenoid-binding protein YceI